MQEAQFRRGWHIAFVLYGVLSLSSMAGMGVGSGIFLAATLVFFALLPPSERNARLSEVLRTPYSWLTAALFFACVLSLAVAKVFPVEGSLHEPNFLALKKFHYFLYPPLLAAAFLHSWSGELIERHPFWRLWGGMGAFLGVLALTQYFGASLFPPEWLHSQFFRQIGGTGHYHGQGLMFFHLSFASCICFVAAVGCARLVFPLPGESVRLRLFWLAVAALGSVAVFLSFSRIAFFALASMIVLLGFLKRPRWGVAVVGVTLSLAFLLWSVNPTLRERFEQSRGSWFERVSMWRTAWLMFQERPLTGVGFSRTGELSPYFVQKLIGTRPDFTSHAHNNLLDMLAATGLMGTLAFLAWSGFLVWACLRVFQRSPASGRWLPAAALMGFTAFHINGLTQVNFWDGKSEHTLMVFTGLALALWIRSRQENASPAR